MRTNNITIWYNNVAYLNPALNLNANKIDLI